MPCTHVAVKLRDVYPAALGNFSFSESGFFIQPYGILVFLNHFRLRESDGAVARQGAYAWLFHSSASSVASLPQQFLTVELQILPKAGKRDPALMGSLLYCYISFAEQLNGLRISQLGAGLSATVLIVGYAEPLPFALAAFDDVRIMCAELIGEAACAHAEYPCDFRHIHFDKISIVARHDCVAILSPGYGGLSFTVVELAFRVGALHAVTLHEDVAVAAAQVSRKSFYRQVKALAYLGLCHVGVAVQSQRFTIFRCSGHFS